MPHRMRSPVLRRRTPAQHQQSPAYSILPKLQNPPNTPQEPLILREVELRASTINASNQVRTSSKLDFHKTCDVHLGSMRYPGGKSSSATALLPRLLCRTCAELQFQDDGTPNRPGRIRNASCSTTPKLPFPVETTRIPKISRGSGA